MGEIKFGRESEVAQEIIVRGGKLYLVEISTAVTCASGQPQRAPGNGRELSRTPVSLEQAAATINDQRNRELALEDGLTRAKQKITELEKELHAPKPFFSRLKGVLKP